MNILISNDDGITSIGLESLVKAFSKAGDVYVAAPDSERSANSHHLTCIGKVKIEEREIEGAKKAYAVWGTPADCVYLGLDFLYKDKIDLVVSGVNKGPNTSTDIVYSGTIGAAREAYIHEVPSMAVSLDNDKVGNYDIASEYAVEISKTYLKDENRKNYFLNINVPDLKKEDIKGIKVCDKSAILHYDNNLSLIKEDNETFIKLNEVITIAKYDKDDLNVDYTAIKNGYVTVSALYNNHFDLEYTDHVTKTYEK